jgi:hypothetical protein
MDRTAGAYTNLNKLPLVGRTHGTPEIISQLQVMRKEPHKI